MIRHKSFVFKLKPDGATRRSLAKACGCVRFVYNKALDWNKEQREKDQTFRVNYPKLCALLPEWKEKFPWLGECHSQVLQQGMKDLMTAMVNFFEGRSQFPRFHKKFKDEDSIRYPQGFKVDEARRQIYLPKIGWVGYRRSRFINGKLRSVTVMRKADGWYVSVLTEREIEAPVHPKAGREIGLDAGVKKTAALSNGKIYLPVDAFRSSKEKLAKLQRRLKRMVRFSKNWKKQQKKIAKLHKKIADTRRDHLQKLTTDICKNHAVVYREDLKLMKPGAMIVDVACDDEGAVETCRSTTHDDPVYKEEGILHYCVDNIPSAFAQTASITLANATCPMLLQVADKGFKKAIEENPYLRAGMTCYDGKLTLKETALKQNRPWTDAEDLIKVW